MTESEILELEIEIEAAVDGVLETFEPIKQVYGSSFNKAMTDMAAQEGSREYGGSYNREALRCLAGGLSELVLNNLSYKLRGRVTESYLNPLLQVADAIVLARAMKKSADFHRFMSSVIAGATKAGNFDNYKSRAERKMRDVILKLI